MSPKIMAVVVTYNRAQLLPTCIEALLAQSRSLDAIVVVDNASSDETASVLQEYSGQVQVISLMYNSGGAGGFHTGIKYALEQGADWVWLMDDDGFPEVDTLEQLIAKSDGLGIVNPLVCVIGDRNHLSFGLRVEGKLTSSAEAVRRAASGTNVLRDEVNPFNGTLIRAATISKIGNVKPEMFIWGDEVEFIYRAVMRGIPVGTVSTAVFSHPLNRRKTVSLGRLGAVTECPPAFSHIFYRNMGFYTLRYQGLVKAIGKFGIYATFLLSKGRWREFAKLVSYYPDGATDLYRLSPSRRHLIARLGSSGEGIRDPS